MEWLGTFIFLTGIVALILRIGLGLFFAEESNREGSKKWVLKNILWIIFGFCFFLFIGLVLILGPLLDNEEPLYLPAVYAIIFGIAAIWHGANVLLHRKTKWIYFLGFIVGGLLIGSNLGPLIKLSESPAPSNLINSNIVSLIMGILVIIYSAVGFFSFTPGDTNSSKIKNIETSI